MQRLIRTKISCDGYNEVFRILNRTKKSWVTVKKTIFLSLTVLFRYQRIISTDKYLIFSSVTVLSGYPVRLKTDFLIFLPYHAVKNTVPNSIFWNWIRKKWIFVRLKILFFVLQPYMGGKVPRKPLRKSSAEASGPSWSDWNGRMPLLFCRRLNSSYPPKLPGKSMDIPPVPC